MAIGAPTAPQTGGPPQGGAAASGGAASGAKPPPFGSSNATQATPNAGADAVAVQGIGAVVTMLQNLLTKVGAQSEPGQAILKALTVLTKAVPAGTVAPAVQGQVLDQAKMQNTQMGNMQAQMRAKALQAGAPGGGGGPPPAGGMAA